MTVESHCAIACPCRACRHAVGNRSLARYHRRCRALSQTACTPDCDAPNVRSIGGRSNSWSSSFSGVTSRYTSVVRHPLPPPCLSLRRNVGQACRPCIGTEQLCPAPRGVCNAVQHQRVDDETLAVVESLLGSVLADASPSDAAAVIAADVAMRTEVPSSTYVRLLTCEPNRSASAAVVKGLHPCCCCPAADVLTPPFLFDCHASLLHHRP